MGYRLAMPIPDDEDLFRFIDPVRDYHWLDGADRLRSSIFRKSYPISFNRGTVWSCDYHLKLLDSHPKLSSEGWGLFSMTAGEIRCLKGRERDPLDVVPDPILSPDVDHLLQIENPSHASLTRSLVGSETRNAERIASQNIVLKPRRLA